MPAALLLLLLSMLTDSSTSSAQGHNWIQQHWVSALVYVCTVEHRQYTALLCPRLLYWLCLHCMGGSSSSWPCAVLQVRQLF
jgi:hypothetical protein